MTGEIININKKATPTIFEETKNPFALEFLKSNNSN